MHFALPPRKTSFPPPYARVSAQNSSNRRRKQIQLIGYLVGGTIFFLLLLSWMFGGSPAPDDGLIREDASVLIVTVVDERRVSKEQVQMIKNNRNDYATRHGYRNFYTNTSTYEHLTAASPASWAMVPALRHALTLYPDVDYLWALDANALIMTPELSLYQHIFEPLPGLMRKDIPIVPPDSVIHTFSHLQPSQVYLILAQDRDNLAHSSLILRNTARIPVARGMPKDSWTTYFLDAWFDPLYRAYAFQRAEKHALEHIVQWHPTVLAKVAIVGQRQLNSYNYQNDEYKDSTTGKVSTYDSKWQPGDFVANMQRCTSTPTKDCTQEMSEYYKIWQEKVKNVDAFISNPAAG